MIVEDETSVLSPISDILIIRNSVIEDARESALNHPEASDPVPHYQRFHVLEDLKCSATAILTPP